MRALRLLGNGVLWLVAVVGVLSVLVFGATKLGYLKPLVVVSGSMEPGIMTGDLLIDTPHPTSDLEVGDVASIPSAVTGKLISHRVVAIEAADGHYAVNLKGDANKAQDGETYAVGATVWRPVLDIPYGGYVVTTLTKPGVAVPLGVALLALISMSWIGDGASVRPRRDDEAAAAGDPATGGADDPVPAGQLPDPVADLTTLAGR